MALVAERKVPGAFLGVGSQELYKMLVRKFFKERHNAVSSSGNTKKKELLSPREE